MPFAITPANLSQNEGNSPDITEYTFTVSRRDPAGDAEVPWVVVGSGYFQATDTDFKDGTLPSGTAKFKDGELETTITVPVLGDDDVERDETFDVVLLPDPNAAPADRAQGVIVNDDSPIGPPPPPPPPPNGSSLVSIVPQDADKPEGDTGTTDFIFTVTRSDGVGAASVAWQVVGGGYFGATPSDFTGNALPTGTVDFANGETSKDIKVPVAGDTDVELDELFRVVLSAPSGTSIDPTKGFADGNIRNDDQTGTPPPPPTAPVQISIQPTDTSSREEGDIGTTDFNFTVTRTGDLTGQATVDWKVVGTGYFPADANDFFNSTLPTGTVTFLPSSGSETITLKVNGDTTFEPNEAFQVLLTNPSGAILGTASAFGTILNDDA